MSRPVQGKRPVRRERFPWLLLLAVLGTIYLFWILPRQIGPKPVQVEFPAEKGR
ncbi:MAG TPA: hypothetical protein VGE01_13135 [Fimbriimonas sp.]